MYIGMLPARLPPGSSRPDGGGRHPGAVIVPARVLVQHVVDQQNAHMHTANCQNGRNGLLLGPANRLTDARRGQPVIRPSRGGSLE
jgi:hypothetical protein